MTTKVKDSAIDTSISGIVKGSAGNLVVAVAGTDYLAPAAIGTTVQAYDADLTSWAGIAPSAKQDALVSATNIKTVNSTSLLGSGNVAISVVPNITIAAKTSNYTLVAGDVNKFIDCTSGTFTLSFTAAATLDSGWFVYLRNNGTGEITLDPNASELIDGLATYIMYPGESRLVMCDGAAFTSIVLSSFYVTYTGSGTFTKPPGYLRFEGLLWGAGAGGAKASATNTAGGGGGACIPLEFLASSLSATTTVTIGSGGLASTTATTTAGGNSTFNGITAYGGTSIASSIGGSAFFSGLILINTDSYPLGGGGNSTSIAYYGGGGGSPNGATYGRTVYGGGGGGWNANGVLISPPTTIFGGAGGIASTTGAAGNGTAPGGGGGGTGTGTAGAGAAGELRLWGVL